MRKQPLDHRRFGDSSGLVAGGFVDRVSDLAGDSVWAELGFERAGLAVEFARAITDCAVFHHAVVRHGESATVGHQLVPAGANIDVGFRVVGEVAAREGAIRALGFVEHDIRRPHGSTLDRDPRPWPSPAGDARSTIVRRAEWRAFAPRDWGSLSEGNPP